MTKNLEYKEFLEAKIVAAGTYGIEINKNKINPIALPHQRDIIHWSLSGGRRAIFAELNPEYYDDGLFYLKSIEYKINVPTLFDFMTE